MFQIHVKTVHVKAENKKGEIKDKIVLVAVWKINWNLGTFEPFVNNIYH